jgi:hypothetical protein
VPAQGRWCPRGGTGGAGLWWERMEWWAPMEEAASTRRWRGRACAGKTGRYPFIGDLHSAPKQHEGRGEGGLDDVSGCGRHLRRATQAGPHAGEHRARHATVTSSHVPRCERSFVWRGLGVRGSSEAGRRGRGGDTRRERCGRR